jgi:DNA-binding NarL/FixJ family response regulator
MLLDSRERDLVIDAFRCGARGVVFRDEPLETLGKCIHAVHRGQVWANSQQLGYILEALSLTPGGGGDDEPRDFGSSKIKRAHGAELSFSHLR